MSKSGIRIVYNKLLGGWFVVRGPHQSPLGGRFESRQEALAYLQTPPHLRGADSKPNNVEAP